MAFSLMYWKEYTHDSTKLSRRSENAVDSGRVLRFVFDDELQYIQANVQGSMRDTSYRVRLQICPLQIQLGEDFDTTMTSCECAMQEFKCHHVAAVLLYGYKNVSKTDLRCTWIKNPKSVPPKETQTVADLHPEKDARFRALARDFTQHDRDRLYHRLSGLGRYTALHWILSPEPQGNQLDIPLVEDVLISQEYLASEEQNLWLRRKLLVSPEQIQQTAELTVGQRENALWAAARKLRFTSSNFGAIISAAGRNRMYPSLKKRLTSAYNLAAVASIQWGIFHEKTALQAYKSMGSAVQDTGIWLHESGVLAASPDGIVTSCPTSPRIHMQGTEQHAQLVEVKCPHSVRDGTVTEAAQSKKDFFLAYNKGQLSLKTSHDYYHQIQGQLHITNKRCCDLVVWTTKDTQVIRISRDNAWISNMALMVQFYFNKFIPSLKE